MTDRTRIILEDLEAVRENMLALSSNPVKFKPKTPVATPTED